MQINSLAFLTLVAALTSAAPTRQLPTPQFSADRYPTGAQPCSWLNWIADRTGADSIESVRADLAHRIDSMGSDTWAKTLGNGVLDETFSHTLKSGIADIAKSCVRDRTIIKRCEGITDIACKFQDYTADDTSIMYNKTDGAVASPPNHKVVFENSMVRVVNVYCPPASDEFAFHTHTRLSFWVYWGSSRGETMFGYNGTELFDQPLWDRQEPNTLKVMWNGPEWFHLIREKEPDTAAPGNCPVDQAPVCPNGFKYRVELKLNDALEMDGFSLVRNGITPTI